MPEREQHQNVKRLCCSHPQPEESKLTSLNNNL